MDGWICWRPKQLIIYSRVKVLKITKKSPYNHFQILIATNYNSLLYQKCNKQRCSKYLVLRKLIVSDQSNYNLEDEIANLNFRNSKYITVDMINTIDQRIVTSQ